MDTIPVTNHLLHLAYSKKDDDDLSPLRVQKLLYFLHGWYLAVTGTCLLSEPFIRGKYGPVLVSLETELKRYGALPVADYIKRWDGEKGAEVAYFVNLSVLPQFAAILENVWAQYRRLSTAQLSSISHSEASPWAHTAPGKAIDNELIKQEFLSIARYNRQSSTTREAR